MNAIQTTGTTGPDGTLTLRVPVGQPDTEFEAIVVIQPKVGASGTPARKPAAEPWAAADAIRARLKATGRDFGDSAQDIREDRDR
jgi:hypothetical protein